MKDFEQKLERLEEIAGLIRDGNVPLHEAADLFEEGMKLSKTLEGALQKLERRIEILVNEPEGPEEAPVLELFPELDRSEDSGRQGTEDGSTID